MNFRTIDGKEFRTVDFIDGTKPNHCGFFDRKEGTKAESSHLHTGGLRRLEGTPTDPLRTIDGTSIGGTPRSFLSEAFGEKHEISEHVGNSHPRVFRVTRQRKGPYTDEYGTSSEEHHTRTSGRLILRRLHSGYFNHPIEDVNEILRTSDRDRRNN